MTRRLHDGVVPREAFPPGAGRALVGLVGLVGLVAALLALRAPAACAQGVHVALMPHTENVAPGAGFDVELDVTDAGSNFNGFDAIVRYDPGALTFVPTSPASLQQGSYMAGACPNRFHLFNAAGDSLSITDVLLCNAVSVTGPGQIYKLHFVASATPQVTYVRIRRAIFYDAGVYVTPVVTQDDTVAIGPTVGVPGSPAAAPTLELRATPNPCVGRTTIRVNTALPGEQSLIVCDITGRVVRHLQGGRFEPGTRAVAWDGRDDPGRALPSGVYVVRAAVGYDVRQARLVLLR